MKAIIYERFGPPDVLELREVAKPEVPDDGVLVRVRAASVNPVDWHWVTGMPYLARLETGWRKPKTGRIGTDFAGVAEAVGKDVDHVRPGDEVFGARNGAFAEYVVARKAVVPKPAGVSFEDAAALPVAGVTALQALRDRAGVQPGQKVLVNGASGGVGTFAVQLAKAFGADVTGVCSTRNVELVRSLGADRVIDYTREDFVHGGERYDVMVDIPANRSWPELKRVLADDATYVLVGGPKDNRLFASFGLALRRRAVSVVGSRKVAAPFVAKLNHADLAYLGDLVATGQVKPAIERRYSFGEVADAVAYVGKGHSRAKSVIDVSVNGR